MRRLLTTSRVWPIAGYIGLVVAAMGTIPAILDAQAPEPSDQPWLQAASLQYTIHYVAQYEHDIEFVRRWLDATEQLMLDKYEISTHGVDVDVYLEPKPTGHAGVGRALIYTQGSQEERSATIFYMTPSAPEWEQARRQGWTTGIGRPFDDHYHAKTLTHEYVTVAHQYLRNGKDTGWTSNAPSWFVQGLEEHDGLFHTTPENRTDGFEALMRYADEELRTEIHCCETLAAEQTLGTTDPYFGGTVILRFLADAYGESIHAALLRSPEPSFNAALGEELKRRGATIPEAFTALKGWFGPLVQSNTAYTPSLLYTGRSSHRSNGFRFEVRILNNDRRPANHELFQHQYRSDASLPWTTESSLAVVPPGLDTSNYSTPLSPPFQWRARSCPRHAQNSNTCSNWSNIIVVRVELPR